MRVALIAEVFLPKVDGVVHRTLNLIDQLRRRGDELLVICPQAPGCNAGPVPVKAFPSFSFPFYPEYRIGLPNRALIADLSSFAPDVVHFINPFAFGFRCHDLLTDAGVRFPTVFSFHTLYGEFVKRYRVLRPLSGLLWWLTRTYHNRADVNLTVSTVMCHELRERGFERVELWPPAVDTALFHPGRRDPGMRARLSDGRPDQPLMLTVSRLAPEKNVAFLAEVLDAVPEARLAIVGDGPQRAELERRFQDRPACFLGYLRGEELAAAYASADVFVYASETETMGNVVLEAMASGCAVVAPRAGGIPSLLTDGESGFLYRPGDVTEAARLVRQALGDAALRRRVGEKARQMVEQRSWGPSINRVRQIYAETIAAPRPAMPADWNQQAARLAVRGLVATFRAVAAGQRVPPVGQRS
ncbi:MAG: glycosyltransferase family 1 protein [Gemmataceae bacterium]|nr:glycosyltransferase family 1 protein [Gemmataceae bacterium]MDW8267161.1 glycosyltransferase family 1 protein [Gemmataceae bacterium]